MLTLQTFCHLHCISLHMFSIDRNIYNLSEDTRKESIQQFSETCFKRKDKMVTCQITFL